MCLARAARVIVARSFALFATGLAALGCRVSNTELSFDFGTALSFIGVGRSRCWLSGWASGSGCGSLFSPRFGIAHKIGAVA